MRWLPIRSRDTDTPWAKLMGSLMGRLRGMARISAIDVRRWSARTGHTVWATALVACVKPAVPEHYSGAVVCGHLSAIGCPQPRLCAEAFDAHHGLTYDLKPACIMAAHTPADATACRTVACR